MCNFCDLASKMSGSKVVKDREIVKTMMAYGVKSKDCQGWTPLHHAIFKKLPKMVEKILKFYEINELKAFLTEPLAHSVYFYNQDFEINKVLFNHGIDPNEECMAFGIINTILREEQESIKLFFDHGFEVDKVMYGKTSLQHALEYGSAKSTKLLIQYYGASLGIRDQDGNTALEITIQPPTPPLDILQTVKLKMFKQIVYLESNF